MPRLKGATCILKNVIPQENKLISNQNINVNNNNKNENESKNTNKNSPCIHMFKSSAVLTTDTEQESRVLHLTSKSRFAKDKQCLPFDDVSRFAIDIYQTPPWTTDASHLWHKDAKRASTEDNAGGVSAAPSETSSIQYFYDRFKATNFLLELEVQYIFHWKMADFITTINEHRVGVSVTRAMGFPNLEVYSFDQAKTLLTKKLTGLILAHAGISEQHNFYTSFLHIWAPTIQVANTLKEAYDFIISEENKDMDLDYEARIKGVIVLVSVCRSDFLYPRVGTRGIRMPSPFD